MQNIMKLFHLIKINNWILIIASTLILTTAIALFYMVPILSEIVNIKDVEVQKNLMLESIVTVPFISLFILMVLSYMVLPFFFFFKNISTFKHKWLFAIACLFMFIFAFQLFLAVFCLICFITQLIDEFKVYREQNT